MNGSKKRFDNRRAALTLVIILGSTFTATVLPWSSAESSTIVSNPAHAIIVKGRFTTTVKLDGGLVTVSPAPKGLIPKKRRAGVESRVWATTQIYGYAAQTFGFGIVSITMRSNAHLIVKKLPAWVGFANGNVPGTSCAKTGEPTPVYTSNGEAVVIIGDAPNSTAAVFIPKGCVAGKKARLEEPLEDFSVAWKKVGKVDSKGLHLSARLSSCARFSGNNVTVVSGHVIKITLFASVPDVTASSCHETSSGVIVPLALSVQQANTSRFVHGRTGPFREARRLT